MRLSKRASSALCEWQALPDFVKLTRLDFCLFGSDKPSQIRFIGISVLRRNSSPRLELRQVGTYIIHCLIVAGPAFIAVGVQAGTDSSRIGPCAG